MTALSAAAPGRPQAVAPLGGSFAPVVVASLVLHIMIFAGIPLAARLLYRSTVYERPKTFTLVNMPVQAVQAVRQAVQNKPKATTPVPAKKRVKTAGKSEEKQEEKKDDLDELLDAIPTRVSEISSGQSSKYGWYTNIIKSKVEENWKPPQGLTNRKDVSTKLTFSIQPTGEITGLSIMVSSGIPTLDNLALKAIKAAMPFGKPPIGFSTEPIVYVLFYDKQQD